MVCLQKRTAPDSEAKGHPEGQKTTTSAQQSEVEIDTLVTDVKRERCNAEIKDPQGYSQAVQDHRAWQATPSQADEKPSAAQEEQACQASVQKGSGSASIRRQADRAFVRQAVPEVMRVEQVRRRIEQELQATRTEVERLRVPGEEDG
jgi:hypothetical protein